MSLLVTVILAALIFILAWVGIGFVPDIPPRAGASPPPFQIRTVLYIALIIVAIVWLLRLGHFV